jgi:hypothetical protein
MKYVI